jgi:predicted RNase H-like HicB family nuclease
MILLAGGVSQRHGGGLKRGIYSNDPPAQEEGARRMKFQVTVDRDEDGVWVVECPSIPGCVSQGDTKEEALENVREAISLCLEVRAERGLPLTIETRQIEVLV